MVGYNVESVSIGAYDETTGHALTCNRIECPNRGYRGHRVACRVILNGGQNCGGMISRQACGKNLCIKHWVRHCELIKWDSNLSSCANIKADQSNMSGASRATITQYNIRERLGLPGDYRHGHISESRRRWAYDDDIDDEETNPVKRPKVLDEFNVNDILSDAMVINPLVNRPLPIMVDNIASDLDVVMDPIDEESSSSDDGSDSEESSSADDDEFNTECSDDEDNEPSDEDDWPRPKRKYHGGYELDGFVVKD